ncbi:hypothetical protein [Clostridium botulinum]|uniref:Uncharacterized protein n=1 Tax=Clostridium botulinum TaxID=1491 RepID=A0A9Q1V174_CLOBO|nr:hypothetical protein [Clostridium botulinum]AEB76644.1 conserved hypothetical protein [Clostridium botulinum BKT015925]KEI03051.1 hypothetical protein Y848_05940 [Clostridium botulinum C/D str. Sp77]KEI02940.1 hypothetical protein Z953_05655 [Clostridium botulinum D str. 16868]KLU76179.1 hypothetical protein CBC3_05025 [Clostridium botulinum V891]KOA73061.1 hypothetical protein ADU78_13470 [Clostridium botulinum]
MMWGIMFSIPQEFITPIISATSVIIGSLIGGICSWITAKHSMKKSMEIQSKTVKDNRRYDQIERINNICQNVNIIRLDVCTAIFQSIRNIKEIKEKNYINRYPIPINKDYSKVLSCLNKKFDLKELSYIYELYGIIEILNKDLKEFDDSKFNKYDLIKHDCELLLKKIYGENYINIQEIDIDKITYKELYDNNIIKEGYKRVFRKLEQISNVEECCKIDKIIKL